MHSIQLQTKSPFLLLAVLVGDLLLCLLQYSFGFLHNHKVIQRQLIVERGWYR